jgi:repressor LexA
MRRKDESKKPIISDFINAFYYEHDKVPSVREIVEGTGIPLSTVHRYLRDMQEKGELSYNGYRSARTKEMSEVSPIHGIAVMGTVACGPGQEEEQRFIETIRMPETLVEKAEIEKHHRRRASSTSLSVPIIAAIPAPARPTLSEQSFWSS